MKKIKKYLNFLVDKQILSYVVPFYFSIALSVIYSLISYFLIFEYSWRASSLFELMLTKNIVIILYIIMVIWLYFIVTLWYKLWKHIFKKYIKDNDITNIKSFFIFIYRSWPLFLFTLISIFFLWTTDTLPFYLLSIISLLVHNYLILLVFLSSLFLSIREFFDEWYNKLSSLTMLLVFIYFFPFQYLLFQIIFQYK